MGMSPETAAWVSDWANAVLVGSLIVGVVSTYFIVITGNVKETALKREIASANVKTAELEKETAEANRRAEADRLARIQIEQKLADRSLSDAQFSALIGAALKFRGQQYEVTTYWDAREPMAISNRISHALSFAGWAYLQPKQGRWMIGITEGIEVYAHPAAEAVTKDAAAMLVKGLGEFGLAAQLKDKNAPDNPDNVISLNIGIKPR